MDPTERGEERIWLCRTKILLLSTIKSRQEALTAALLMEDQTQYQKLKRWAIKELGKLGTEESRSTLIAFAIELQSKYYDENGKCLIRAGDRLGVNAGEFYRTIVKMLKRSDMSDSEIRETGLQPDKYFFAP